MRTKERRDYEKGSARVRFINQLVRIKIFNGYFDFQLAVVDPCVVIGSVMKVCSRCPTRYFSHSSFLNVRSHSISTFRISNFSRISLATTILEKQEHYPYL